MKKIYSLAIAAALFAGAQASASTFPVVFNGSDDAGWTYGDNGSIKDGHLTVTMTENNGKWRQDLAFNAGSEATDFSVNAGEMKLLAVKFIGARPQGNMTLEIQYRDGESVKWMNTQWKNRPGGSVMTPAGNNIYYYDLTKDEAWKGTVSISRINFKIADNTAEPHSYVIDWINLYPSVESIEADWKDDGAGDLDEEKVVESPVMIGTKGFANLADAFSAAADGGVIVLNENQTVSGSRLNINGRDLTVKAGKEGIVIKRGVAANSLMVLSNAANKTASFEGITFDGDNLESTACTFEASGSGRVAFTDCSFINFKTTNGQGIVSCKNGGKAALKNVKFSGNTVNEGRGEIFIGSAGSTIEGENEVSLYLEKQNAITAGELSGTSTVKIYVDDNRALMQTVTVTEGEGDDAVEKDVEQKSILVANCKNVQGFAVATSGFGLEADEELNALVLTKSGTAVSEVEIADENAPVEYYNLQGMKVSGELAPGIYVRRQGNNVVKVLIK